MPARSSYSAESALLSWEAEARLDQKPYCSHRDFEASEMSFRAIHILYSQYPLTRVTCCRPQQQVMCTRPHVPALMPHDSEALMSFTVQDGVWIFAD